jgi:Rhomboid family
MSYARWLALRRWVSVVADARCHGLEQAGQSARQLQGRCQPAASATHNACAGTAEARLRSTRSFATVARAQQTAAQRTAWQAVQQLRSAAKAAPVRTASDAGQALQPMAAMRLAAARGARRPSTVRRPEFSTPANLFAQGRSAISFSPRSWQPEQVIYAIMGANVVVFAMWQVGCFQKVMWSHFCTSFMHLRLGYIHTLLTSSISQQSMPHLFTNMFTFYFFGTSLIQVIGTVRVRSMYVLILCKLLPAHVIWHCNRVNMQVQHSMCDCVCSSSSFMLARR